MNSTRAIHAFVSLVFKANVFGFPSCQNYYLSLRFERQTFLRNRQIFPPVKFVQPGCLQWVLTKWMYFINGFSNTQQIKLLGKLRNEEMI